MGIPVYAKEVLDSLLPIQKVAFHNQYLLSEESPYTFHDGDRYMLSASSDLTNSYGVIESRLLQDEIVPSDFFIAYSIAMIGASDINAIQKYMRWLHARYPDKIIPYNISTTTLRTRLEKLARAGVIRCFSIVREGVGKKGLFYGISELGAKAVRRRLDISFLSYDTWPLIDCEQRVWRRLSANRLGVALMELNPEEPPKFYTEIYDKSLGAKVPVYVRHTCKYRDTDGNERKAFIMVEPVSFITNKYIKTEEELEKDIKDRIRALMSRVDIALGKGEQTKNSAELCDTALVIFVVDDMAGLKKTAALVYELSAMALENCLFTTERIVTGNDGKLNRCFFSAKATQGEDGTISVKAMMDANHSDIFGVDDFTDNCLTEEEVVGLGLAQKTGK